MDRCNLYNYRFLISSCFLQGYDKLSQVFDRVDIMVRGGGNGIGSFRNHSCPGYISHDLCTWQMASDTRFCTLTHLYFNGGTTLKISSPYSESTRSNLNHCILSILVEIFMKTTFTCVVEDTKLLCSLSQSRVCIVADGAVAHGRKHDRKRKLQLRRKVIHQFPILVSLDSIGFLSKKHPCLHRLTKWIYGRVRHLACVYKDLVPIDRVRFRISHGRKKDSPCVGFLNDAADDSRSPVCVITERTAAFHYFYGMLRTEGDTSQTINALSVITEDHFLVL